MVLTFESVYDHSNDSYTLLYDTFLWCCLLCCTRWLKLLKSMDEILKCDHSNESYGIVLSCGTVYYAVQGGSNF